jgi:ABC-2 type transport system permease protein
MIRAVLILAGHSLKRVRALVGVMSLVLATFQVLTSLMATTFQESRAFERITALVPDFVRQLMGPALVGMLSFTGVVCLGYFHFAVVGVLVGLAIALATEPSSEIDSGFADLILARPVSRHAVIARSVVLVVSSTVFVLVMMMLGTWAGLAWLAPAGAVWPKPRLVVSLAVNLGALMLCWGGMALALSAASRRRSVAASCAGVTALGLYLFDVIARVWRPARPFAWVSPFHYYNPLDLVMGRGITPSHLWVLAGVGVAGAVIAHFVYSRRDL